MKIRTLPIILKVMKLSIYGMCLQAILLNAIFASNTNGQKSMSVRDVFIDIQLKNASVEEAFASIESKTDYKFNYEHLSMEDADKLSMKRKNVSVADVLIEISRKSQLSFKQINKSINVAKRQDSNPVQWEVTADADVTISGKVTDENGEGLPGASIIAKGTTIGTTTDFDGNYKLIVPENSVLVVSFIGYLSQEINVGGRSVVDIQMQVDAQKLEEVVVVGYGTQERANVTGAMAGVKAKDFENFPVTSFDQGLAGQIAGVNIVQGTGSPGSAPSIQIRGVGTLTAGTGPLLVIDGFPTDNINLSDINPNDIESVNILKDAASASIYGSRGANGVVMVTTKRGEADQLRINLNVYSGVQQVAKTYDMADAYQWSRFHVETLQQRSGLTTVPSLYQPYLNGTPGLTSTDWQDEIFRNAGIHSYQVSLSGGSEKTSFYVSGEVFNQEGVIIGSDFKRYSLRANLNSNLLSAPDASFLKNVNLGINLVPTYTTNQRVSESHHNNDGIVITGLYAHPNFAAYNADGTPNISEQTEVITDLGYGAGRFENPVAVAMHRDNRVQRTRLLGNTYLELELIEGLTAKTSLGFNYADASDRLFRPSLLGARRDPAPTTASGSLTGNKVLNWANENTISYAKSINESHNFSVLAGYSIQKEQLQSSFISGQGFATDDAITLDNAETTTGTSNEEEWALISYLARANYDFKGKYLVSASIRRDGSSRFGTDTKWGTFPALSVGWRISEESFFSDIKSAISDLKLRASYGLTGNNQIGNYGATALLSRANYSFAGGLYPSTAPNSDLSWEETAQLDIGLDIGLFNDRVSIVLDYYKSTTDGLLLEVPVPSASGFETSLQNLGKVENKGFEAAISARGINLGPIEWTASFNISSNRNKVLELGPGQEEIISKFHKTAIGQPLGQFYTYNIIGVYNNQQEIDATPHRDNAQPGDYIWEDVNGNGEIDNEDRSVAGDVFPDFTYGFSSTFKYKGIDLSFLIQGSEGNELTNFTGFFITRRGDWVNVTSDRVEGRWQSASQPGTGYARAGAHEWQYDQSNRLVEDASYLRVRNITLGYTFPTTLTSKARIQKARIYFSSINPFTFTNYSGYNPESNSTIGTNGSPLEPGIDWGNYPIARSFTLGVNLTF